ncbi:hypothetical protein B9Z19DRAFT_1066113 [Tuber borchii]|uniref:ABC transporter domain-containing protein n=1 Tax=Tuber borchii TaxID=42251 RepID=A0A2T6ZNL6_TUBBO|nr:hypothetical protein B9Z19DRAFT_1066113 [Tuber borchii]
MVIDCDELIEKKLLRKVLNRKNGVKGEKARRKEKRLAIWGPQSSLALKETHVKHESAKTTPSGQLRLLNEIYVRPGELTALMGASGAEKTTLLDILASRKNIGVITGDVLVDGKPKGTAFQQVHRISAYLRQPYEVSRAEEDAYVDEVIALLEMENIAYAITGDPTNGSAVEERKRVTIGAQLASKPQLLVFLDELASGIDSQSAFNIVRFL